MLIILIIMFLKAVRCDGRIRRFRRRSWTD